MQENGLDAKEPKYKQVKHQIIEHIREHHLKKDDPIASEVELMRQFDVSRHTIRKAIGDLVIEGWLYKQQGRGTFVAEKEAWIKEERSDSHLIGVITTYIKDYIFPEIISGIESVMTDQGYSIILGNTNNDTDKERAILKNMLDHNLAGLIIEPTKSIYPNYNQDLFDQFKERNIPILFIHATYQNVNASFVREDDQEAGYLATKHLIDLGHRRIGGMFKQDDMQGHRRYSGYLKAIRESGLEEQDGNVLWFDTGQMTSIVTHPQEERIKDLAEKFTGIVCYNDQIAISLIHSLEKMGYGVPEDLSLVSFDNSHFAEAGEVKLTTIAHPKGELGKKAATHLLSLINGTTTWISDIIQPELIVRNSVKEFK